MKWLIEYDDGSIFTDENGPAWEAPRTGVMRVFHYDARMQDVFVDPSDRGFWIWQVDQNGDGRFFGVDDAGLWDYLFHYRRSPMLVLYGRYVHDEQWEREILSRATDYFGVQKGCWRVRERA